MRDIVRITLVGIFRDRVFYGILMVALIFLIVPLVGSLSIRQVTELSITLSLSLISFILLLLSVFLGATSVWKDIERRYTYSVISLPISRGTYLVGKFIGISLFLLLITIVLGSIACLVVYFASGIYPSERPILWSNLLLCFIFDALKYILLVAYAFLFSTVSTSFFLPVFGTIVIFLAGSATQQVYDYINSPSSALLSPVAKKFASVFYYVLPNFSAFDLHVNAIYGLAVTARAIYLPSLYFVIYTSLVLVAATMVFTRREMN